MGFAECRIDALDSDIGGFRWMGCSCRKSSFRAALLGIVHLIQ
jgi:hypothetical protein